MSEKMIINANLIRKESEFRTKSCVVEKQKKRMVACGDFRRNVNCKFDTKGKDRIAKKPLK